METTDPRRERPGCQHCLVYTLFIWVTILSVVLAVTLTLVLTHLPPKQEETGVPGGNPHGRYSVSPQRDVPSQEITMEIGNSKVEKYILPWDPGEDEAKPLSVKRERLVVEEGWEGRYFLYIQVTLQSSTSKVPHMVRVKKGDTTLLEGLLTRRGSSELLTTGFLGRQVELYSKESITVSCSPAGYINTTDTATYLGVYLLQRK